MHDRDSTLDYSLLKPQIHALGKGLGFAEIGFARPDPGMAARHLQEWLASGRHGEMDYMVRHAHLRTDPAQLLPGIRSVISLAIDYLPHEKTTDNPELAAISRYAQGRDYHKVIRNRLQKMAETLVEWIGPFGYRVFSDSAPVMEVEYARQAGIGWRGKHTLLLSKQGSWRFLGEIYTDLPLPPDQPAEAHCGTCTACLSACPTGAIIAPYQVDARRCISYLTIELPGTIPIEFRPLIGNRIYGCDDCQTCCPWNRFAKLGDEAFRPRHGLDCSSLLELFSWSEEVFNQRLAGNPIRRIGHARWLRNIAVALGNAPRSQAILLALNQRLEYPSELVQEHVRWAIQRQSSTADGQIPG